MRCSGASVVDSQPQSPVYINRDMGSEFSAINFSAVCGLPQALHLGCRENGGHRCSIRVCKAGYGLKMAVQASAITVLWQCLWTGISQVTHHQTTSRSLRQRESIQDPLSCKDGPYTCRISCSLLHGPRPSLPLLCSLFPAMRG